MARALRDSAAIVGIGQTQFTRGAGRSAVDLVSEAAVAAIADAGLRPQDIDGMVTFSIDATDELALMRNIGVPSLRFTSRTRGGGGGSSATVQHAAAAVASGAADAVLVYRGFSHEWEQRAASPVGGAGGGGGGRGGMLGGGWYVPFGLMVPAQIYALWYQRYMAVYGVTNEDFGRYSVVARTHAANNPYAYFANRPITLDDHQTSRWIVEPILRLLDCCQ